MERLTEWIDEEKAIPIMRMKNNGHQRCVNRLAAYEDAEEYGLLFRVPVKIGDKIYDTLEETVPHHHFYVSESTVEDVSAKGVWYADGCFEKWDDVGKRIFLTREEAEAKVAELESNYGKG